MKWPLCSGTSGQKDVAHPALVNKLEGFIPLLHINLAFINIFVKSTDKEREDFVYLRKKLPKISEAKMKEGIFVGPQIKQILEDQDFSTKSNATDRRHSKISERPF
jgi:hypothetical protein